MNAKSSRRAALAMAVGVVVVTSVACGDDARGQHELAEAAASDAAADAALSSELLPARAVDAQVVEAAPASDAAGTVTGIEAGTVVPSGFTDASPDGSPQLDGRAHRDDATSEGGQEAGDLLEEAGSTSPATSIAGRFVVRPQLFVDVDLDPSGDNAGDNDAMHPVLEERDSSQLLTRPAWVVGYLGPMMGRLGSTPSADAGAAQDDTSASEGGVDADASPVDSGTEVEVIDAAPQPKLPSGPSALSGDNVDYYRVSLERGDIVTLYLFDAPGDPQPTRADLDLYLLNAENWNIAENGEWVDDSIGTGDVEQVSAPYAGIHWIAVQRHLDVGSDTSAAASYALAVQVPVGTIAREAIAQGRLSSNTDVVEGSALVRMPLGPPSATLSERLELSDRRDSAGYRRAVVRSERGRSGDPRASAYAIKRLRKDPGVIAAEPELRFSPQGTAAVDDPEFAAQWHLWPVDTLSGWEQSQQAALRGGGRALGQGVVVGVIDTGVAFDHPDFRRADGEFQLLQGYDMIDDVGTALDGDGRDPYPDDPGDQSGTGGGTFHGTHVAGIIAAATNNGVGVAGTAPDARVLPIRVMGKNGGVLSDVIDGVLYAAGLPNGSGELPERRADIINLSLAGPGRSPALSSAIDQALDAGVIVVAAAGNFNRPVDEYTPAAEPGVITVSALDASLRLARYSNYAVTDGVIDLTAMGGDLTVDRTLDDRGDGVWSLLFRDDGALLYGYIDGTSMAAAQVSGIAALMKGVWPEMGPDEFRALLPQAVVELGETMEPDFGYGLISAPRAVAAAIAAAAQPPVARPALHVSPRGFDFGRNYDTLPFEILNTGDGELVIHDITSDVSWLSVERREPGANRLSLDRWSSDVEWGRREATLTIHSNAGEARLPVRVLRDEFPPEGDVGEIVVSLHDASSGELLFESSASPADGYQFRFDDLEPGRYRVNARSRFWAAGAPRVAAYRARLPFGDSVLCLGVAGDDCADVELDALIASLLLELR